MLMKSCCMVSIQFFRGLPGFFEPLIFQCTVQLVLAVCCRPFAECAGAITVFSLFYCEIYHLQLCLRPTLSLLTLSFHEIPIIR